jgi:hypothetical protein
MISDYSEEKGWRFFELTDKNSKGIEGLFEHLITQMPEIKLIQQPEIKG